MARENFVGMTLNGDYRLQQVLGEGTSAAVYRAKDRRRKTPVAVKLFKPTIDPVDIREEARIQTGLRHPNVAPLLWFDVAELPVEARTRLYTPRSEQLILPHPFIVMEEANEKSLQERIRPENQPLSVAAVVDYLIQAAMGVQYSHQQGILHRDLKPGNLLLHRPPGSEQIDVLVSDFGIAVPAHSGEYEFTRQVGKGTAEYVAPEQIRGKAIKASDEYALGVIAYELLTGHKPFSADTDGGYLEAHLTSMPPSFEAMVGPNMNAVLAALEAVVMKTLEKNPKARYKSVGNFAEALKTTFEQASGEQVKGRTILDLSVARTQIDQAEQAAKARLEESMAAAAVKVTEIMTRVADIGVTEETLLARVTLLREEAKATSDRIDMLRADERTVSETLQGLYQEVNIQRAREALSQTFVGSYIRTAEHLRRMEIELRKSGTKIEFTHDTEAVSYTTTLYGRTPDGSRLLVVKTTPMLSRLKNFLQGVNEYLILNGMENEADQKILMLIADIEVNIVEQLLAMMPSSTETTPTQHITAEDIAKFIHTHPVETQQIQIQTTKKIGIEFVSGPDN